MMMEDKMNVSPAQVEKCLAGMDYPAGKEELVNKAKMQCDDEKVMNALDMMPDQMYNSPIDVSKTIGGMK